MVVWPTICKNAFIAVWHMIALCIFTDCTSVHGQVHGPPLLLQKYISHDSTLVYMLSHTMARTHTHNTGYRYSLHSGTRRAEHSIANGTNLYLYPCLYNSSTRSSTQLYSKALALAPLQCFAVQQREEPRRVQLAQRRHRHMAHVTLRALKLATMAAACAAGSVGASFFSVNTAAWRTNSSECSSLATMAAVCVTNVAGSSLPSVCTAA